VRTEIPWGGFSATLPTLTFENVYIFLGFEKNWPFWGIDLGANGAANGIWC